MYCHLEGIFCFLDFSDYYHLLGVDFVAPLFCTLDFFILLLILVFLAFFDVVNFQSAGLHLFHHHQLLQISGFFFSFFFFFLNLQSISRIRS